MYLPMQLTDWLLVEVALLSPLVWGSSLRGDSITETGGQNRISSKRFWSDPHTELQPLLSGVHSVMRVKLALAGGCTPTPSHHIYPHQ
jgi:hypothetical protein